MISVLILQLYSHTIPNYIPILFPGWWFQPLWKICSSIGKDDISYMTWKVIKFMFQTTNQITIIFLLLVCNLCTTINHHYKNHNLAIFIPSTMSTKPLTSDFMEDTTKKIIFPTIFPWYSRYYYYITIILLSYYYHITIILLSYYYHAGYSHTIPIAS